MNDQYLTRYPWPRRWVSTLALSTALTFAGTALADDREIEELEVTLEVFEDSEALEAFELRLTEVAEREASDAGSEFPERDGMTERLERFEEEVAAAADGDLLGIERNTATADREGSFEDEIEREHRERMEVAEVDSADALDEFDLAEEEEPEELEEPTAEDEVPDEE